MRRSYTKMMLHLALDLVSFYSVLKKDLAEEIQDFSKDLKESCKDNPNIEIFDSGSGFEDLYLPHADGDRRVNVDADHMIIRNDIPICEIVNQGITNLKVTFEKLIQRSISHQMRLFLRTKCLFLIQNRSILLRKAIFYI